MKIEKTTKVADQVLTALAKLDGPRAYAIPYVNGREKGWTVFPAVRLNDPMGALGVTFAESRNSDQIVLYTGTNPHRHEQPVTEAVYASAQYFLAGEYDEVAQTAVVFLVHAVAADGAERSIQEGR